MKTEQLIDVLAADAGKRRGDVRSRMRLVLIAGIIATTPLFLATMGARADLWPALQTWRFDLKLVLVVGALLAALVDCVRYLRPDARPSLHWSSGLLFILLLLAVIVELGSTPAAAWGRRLVGTNGLLCLVSIPALAVLPFVVLMTAMRAGAPASPARAGAAVGWLAASVGAALYALHCFDDSPLFVAVWYPAAMLAVAAAGALVGSRLLRW